jgi:multidrug resistance efflux pump
VSSAERKRQGRWPHISKPLGSGAPPIKGAVDSIARGIGDTQNPTGSNLLQNVNATFEWVRLAQRIPVRIKLINVPKDTILSSGMTVTVSIIQGTSSKKERIAEIQ